MLIQEKVRLKKQDSHSINFMNQEVDKGYKKKANKFKKKKKMPAKNLQDDKKKQKLDRHHFYKKVGHYQKDCFKQKT